MRPLEPSAFLQGNLLREVEGKAAPEYLAQRAGFSTSKFEPMGDEKEAPPNSGWVLRNPLFNWKMSELEYHPAECTPTYRIEECEQGLQADDAVRTDYTTGLFLAGVRTTSRIVTLGKLPSTRKSRPSTI